MFSKDNTAGYFDPYKLIKHKSWSNVETESNEDNDLSRIQNTLNDQEWSTISEKPMMEQPIKRSHYLQRSLSSFWEHEIKEKYTNDVDVSQIKSGCGCKLL